MSLLKNQLSSDIAEAGKQSCVEVKYEEDKAYILNEVSRFFPPSLRWIEATRHQFYSTNKNIRDYFLVETFEAYPQDSFGDPRVRYVWVKKDSSQVKSTIDIANL